MKNIGLISMIIGIVLFVCVTIGGIVYTYVTEHSSDTTTVVVDTTVVDSIH